MKKVTEANSPKNLKHNRGESLGGLQQNLNAQK